MTNCKECERERPWPILEVLFQRLPLWVTSRYDIIQHSCSSANIPQETLWIEIRYDNDWYSVSFCTHVIAVCSDFIRHKILLINFVAPETNPGKNCCLLEKKLNQVCRGYSCTLLKFRHFCFLFWNLLLLKHLVAYFKRSFPINIYYLLGLQNVIVVRIWVAYCYVCISQIADWLNCQRDKTYSKL